MTADVGTSGAIEIAAPRRSRAHQWRPGAIGAVLLASDPGLVRLRLATRGLVAVGAAAAAEHAVARPLGLVPVVSMLLGGIVAMMGSFGMSGRGVRDGLLTVTGIPVASMTGITAATLLAPVRAAQLAGFAVVMVAAAFVRRFGPRLFIYGMIAWLSYFFSGFINVRPAQLPAMLAVTTLAAACVGLAVVALADRPEALLRRAVGSYRARVRGLLGVAEDLLTGKLSAEQARRRAAGRGFRVLEGALVVDGYVAEQPELGLLQPAGVRHNLLDVELLAEQVVDAVIECAPALAQPEVDALARILGAVRAGASNGVEVRCGLLARELRRDDPDGRRSRMAAAVTALGRLAVVLDGAVHREPHRALTDVADSEPAVAVWQANLPGALGSARASLDAGASAPWWSTRDFYTRLSVQVAIAGPIALVAGDLLSPRRYYWAVLACFLALTGTFTTGEILTKGINRVAGTVLGLVAATLAVHLTGSHDSAIALVMCGCGFAGLYFFRVSYAVMAFAVTTVMGELYNVLGEFSQELLRLRLIETVLGAGIGVSVALVVLPVRTGAARAVAHAGFLDAVAQVLREVQGRCANGRRGADLLLAARRVDAALHQYALVSRPGAGASMLGLSGTRAMRDLGAHARVAYRCRALAGSVADSPLMVRPRMAAGCGAVLAALARHGSSGVPAHPVGALTGAPASVAGIASPEPAGAPPGTPAVRSADPAAPAQDVLEWELQALASAVRDLPVGR